MAPAHRAPTDRMHHTGRPGVAGRSRLPPSAAAAAGGGGGAAAAEGGAAPWRQCMMALRTLPPFC